MYQFGDKKLNINNSFQEYLNERMLSCYRDCLQQILFQFLGYEPIENDFGKVTLTHDIGVFDRDYIFFDTHFLGVIKRVFEENKFNVIFIPA